MTEDTFADRLDDSKDENEKSPEDECMDRSGDGVAHDLGLPDGDHERAAQALDRVIEAVRPLPDAQEIQQSARIIEYSAKGDDKHYKKDNRLNGHRVSKFIRQKYNRLAAE